ncbi:hypothetical protein L550_3617 [Bordetella pertussis H973]|uniref:Uncharacterized protein n=2 Tax=Bordetella TaxID=517 RepID=A0AAI9J1N6_BORPT|nr:hypothetical protein V483_3501 [Bordetella pertussis CHLA-11]ETH01576.1 hypothetical protein L569_3476 [Bordetella pertussis 2250905]ETH04453.1 hypothetical protein L570_3341 [Bordetella pertussis 2356847]ETH08075.1 hypothetical protein L571_3355 [Bordetella pertussis 2371640]ETH12405.1 hypothetical protein L574_3645 [Bordetella pertussis STO1-SEAT-0006]ETH16738.1 hypothetical protein L575_4022 [Bordetella pertussis STO1-SEAT-0007]ETH20255.1 hypothetical protein L563_3479 [Bordetella pertu
MRLARGRCVLMRRSIRMLQCAARRRRGARTHSPARPRPPQEFAARNWRAS